MDASTEELQRMLANNLRGLLAVRDELSGWLGSFDQYRAAGRGADRAFYLECWNGGSFVNDKVKFDGAPVRIDHASLAIIGGMVPDRLREVLVDADDGLSARFLYIWPDPAPIEPLADCGYVEATLRRERLLGAARALRSLSMGTGKYGEPTPRALALDADASRLFSEFDCSARQKARSLSGFSAGWHGKNSGRALRLALTFEMLAWAARGGEEPVSVSANAMARACGYLDYAAAMLDRVQSGLAIGRAEADAAIIMRHLLETNPSEINERELYQTAGFAWLRETTRRKAAFSVLREANWISKPDVAGKGRRRSDWEVSPLPAKRDHR
jgi:putative DNA primase/helicase